MPIEFACPSCAKKYRVKDEYAGKPAKCGQCGHRMRVPQPKAQSAPSQSKPAPTKQAPKPAAKPAVEPLAAIAPSSDLGSWMDDELEVAAPVSSPTTTCPSCHAPLVGDAVICVVCGYDKRSGAKHATELVTESKRKSRGKSSLVGSTAGLMVGTLLSFAGAMIGAAIWAIVAYVTEFEIGWIAIGLGALTGLGMAVGCRDNAGALSGVIAAGMAFVGIIAAKIFIVVIFVASADVYDGEDTEDIDIQRSLVASALASEILEKRDVDLDSISGDQWEEAVEEAETTVDGWTDEQVTERWEQMQAEQLAELEAAADEADQEASAETATDESLLAEDQFAGDDAQAGGGLAIAAIIALVIFSFFGIFDIVFVVLAMGAAYSLGSGQGIS